MATIIENWPGGRIRRVTKATLEVLRMLREADEAGQARIMKTIRAVGDGRLSITKEQAEAMTPEQACAMVDALH